MQTLLTYNKSMSKKYSNIHYNLLHDHLSTSLTTVNRQVSTDHAASEIRFSSL